MIRMLCTSTYAKRDYFVSKMCDKEFASNSVIVPRSPADEFLYRYALFAGIPLSKLEVAGFRSLQNS